MHTTKTERAISITLTLSESEARRLALVVGFAGRKFRNMGRLASFCESVRQHLYVALNSDTGEYDDA